MNFRLVRLGSQELPLDHGNVEVTTTLPACKAMAPDDRYGALMPSQSRHGYGSEFHHKLQTPSSHTSPNINNTKLHPQKEKRCISLVVTEDTWVVVTSEQGYQAESENGLQFSLRVDMPGSLAQRCRACFKMLCNAMSNCQWFPLSCIRTPQQLLHLRRTCLWHYRNGDAGYGSITSRTTDSETN